MYQPMKMLRPRPYPLGIATIVALASLIHVAPVSAEMPSAEEVLSELGFSSDDQKKVMAGEFVTVQGDASNDREIGVGMAFFVPVATSEFMGDLTKGLLMEVDPNAKAHGDFSADPTVADLAGLTVGDQAKDYLSAKAGDDLNLSTAEIAAFSKLENAAAVNSARPATIYVRPARRARA